LALRRNLKQFASLLALPFLAAKTKAENIFSPSLRTSALFCVGGMTMAVAISLALTPSPSPAPSAIPAKPQEDAAKAEAEIPSPRRKDLTRTLPKFGTGMYQYVMQPQAPTCAFLASLCATAYSGFPLQLAESAEQTPARKEKLKDFYHLKRATLDAESKFQVKVFDEKRNAVWVEIVWNGYSAHDPRCADPDMFWPALYQRAYLKYNGVAQTSADGDREVALNKRFIPDGAENVQFALETLTGLPAKSFTPTLRNIDETKARIINSVSKYPYTCVVAGTIDSSKGNKNGGLDPTLPLVAKHNYTILTATDKCIELRNPWGYDIEPTRLKNGNYIPPMSDGYDTLGKGRQVNPNDGLVLISWEDFCANFSHYVIGGKSSDRPAPK
jgi:hypothetical protein